MFLPIRAIIMQSSMDISEFSIKISILFSKKQCISNKLWGTVYPEAVQNIIKIAENFNSDEMDLFYDLISRYTICDFDAYNELTVNAINKILTILPKEVTKVYIFPLIKPEDVQKSKSSHTVVYLYQCLSLRLPSISPSFLFNKGNELLQEPANSNYRVLLVDDFIGTGKTAISCADDYVKNKNVNKNLIIISTFYSMKSGLQNVKNAGYNIITLNTIQRGITDYFSQNELPAKYKIMDELEARHEIPPKYKMGLDQSEALITLMRTPNNTFPIFWSEKFHTPPFRR